MCYFCYIITKINCNIKMIYQIKHWIQSNLQPLRSLRSFGTSNIMCLICRLLIFILILLYIKRTSRFIKWYILQRFYAPICNKFIFKPVRVNEKKYEKWLNHPNIIHELIKTDDDEMLDAMLYNKYQIPSY